MKKIIFSLSFVVISMTTYAQSKFEVKDFGKFKLHAYVTADPLGDMSYIIEGKTGVVVLEPVAFMTNIKEFGDYIAKLNKPVEKVIADYHAGGSSGFDHSKFVMVEGMPEFVKGDAYSGMMKHFTATFGDAMDVSEATPTAIVPKSAKENWVGVEFRFSPGTSSDFPAASTNIGGKVYYMHFAPAVAHFSSLQIIDRNAVDATLKELESAKKSGCTTFIGGHGIGTTDMKAVDFQIAYLRKAKEIMTKETTANAFVAAMKKAYPNVTGEENLTAMAENLYK